MTTRKSKEAALRAPDAKREPDSPWGHIASIAQEIVDASKRLAFPCVSYQERPVEFVREVLRSDPWSAQVEILEAVRDHPRVAITSGHKTGKSRSAAYLAWWFVCSFPKARVIMSSTTSRQVDQILWREVRMMYRESSVYLGGEIHELARSGFKTEDFREIVGFTAREAEAVAGISGGHLLYLLDEASGIPDEIFEAIEGNRAGGARVVMFSNPTRRYGEFFEAFHGKAKFYKTLKISSETTPNCVEGRVIIPGLACREWVDEKRAEWGEDSALYKVRILGQFATAEDGKIISVDVISQAERMWEECPADGRLCIGVDPAGPAMGGDESGFAVRRGNKVTGIFAFRGLSEPGHIVQILGLIKENRRDDDTELPLVLIDRDGPIGSMVYGLARAHLENNANDFEVVGVRASDRAQRQPAIYDRTRDELWASLAEWFRGGGTIPTDSKLERELNAPEWVSQNVTGRIKVTPKDELRKMLERSTDRADAVILSVWRPNYIVANPAAHVAQSSKPDAYEALPETTFDPYAGVEAWR